MLVNINVNHAVFFQPGLLVNLINLFADTYGRNPWQLERFLKKVRVETTHLPIKRNKSGQKVPRIKTIIALANTNDGYTQLNPPRIAKFAAGPKDVQFWLETNSSKADSQNKISKSLATVGYISVYDYFNQCQ